MGELKHHRCLWVPTHFGRSTAAHVLHHFEGVKRPLHACQTRKLKGIVCAPCGKHSPGLLQVASCMNSSEVAST